MSCDLSEAVFDEQGSYLEEKAVRYEHALMEQFAASPEGQAIKEMGGHSRQLSYWSLRNIFLGSL